MKLSEKELKYIREGLLLLVKHLDSMVEISQSCNNSEMAIGFRKKSKEVSKLYVKIRTQGN